jgi:hypothetical protein
MALDGVLCDRPQDDCYISIKRNYARDNISNTTKKETTKMKTMSKIDIEKYTHLFLKDPAAANRYWNRCRGQAQDGVLDDESAGRLKEFLKDKLSAKDHEVACSMLAGDVDAEDDAPYEPVNEHQGEKPRGKLAGDTVGAASFARMFPDSARVKIDTSGLPIAARRPAKPRVAMDDAGVKSFEAMFPDSARIKLA